MADISIEKCSLNNILKPQYIGQNPRKIRKSAIFGAFYMAGFIPIKFSLIGEGEKIMYKTELIGYTPVAKKMAKKIEDKCNEMEKDGYVLISTTITLGAKDILIFKK